MPFLHSTPFIFQHPSQAAHTTPSYSTRFDHPAPEDKGHRPLVPAPQMGGLRGFFEHEEYERIEARLLERIESLKKTSFIPASPAALQTCEQQLLDCRANLDKARKKFARQHESQRAPGTGEADKPELADADNIQTYAIRLKKEDSNDSGVQLSPVLDANTESEAPDATIKQPRKSIDSAVSLADTSSSSDSDTNVKNKPDIAPSSALRTRELPHLGAALLECHAHTDGSGVPYLVAQPTIIWLTDTQRWAEISCAHCDTRTSQDGTPLLGVNGLVEHVRAQHKGEGL